MQKLRRINYRPLKRRVLKSAKSAVIKLSNWRTIQWASAGLISAGCGSMAINLINRLLSHSKRVLRWPKHMSRTWVNIPRKHILTKKAINTRMGKGKGSRAGICARLQGGSLLAAYAEIRQAQQVRLNRWLRVRVPFNIISWNAKNDSLTSRRTSWVRFWRLQTKYINFLIDELDRKLTEIHRPGLFIYYMGIINWRWQAPKGGFPGLPWVIKNRPIRRLRRRAIKHILRKRPWRHYTTKSKLNLQRLGKEYSRRLSQTTVKARTKFLNSLILHDLENEIK